MITIKTTKGENEYGAAELHIAEHTPHTTMLLGIEMLVETLLKEVPTQNIDDLLTDLKRIYIRDNGGKDDEKKNKNNN